MTESDDPETAALLRCEAKCSGTELTKHVRPKDGAPYVCAKCGHTYRFSTWSDDAMAGAYLTEEWEMASTCEQAEQNKLLSAGWKPFSAIATTVEDKLWLRVFFRRRRDEQVQEGTNERYLMRCVGSLLVNILTGKTHLTKAPARLRDIASFIESEMADDKRGG